MKEKVSLRISKQTFFYFLCMMLMLRPSNPALQVMFGSILGEMINVILKAGDYILIAGVIGSAITMRMVRKKGILTMQAWLACGFIFVLMISTIKNGNPDNYRAYYEYLGNIFCVIYLYQNARRNSTQFLSFLKGVSLFLILAMLFNSLSIYIFYPNGMYTLDDGASGNSNYYLFSLDNVGFIISLCSFAVSAVYDQITRKKIKRSTIWIYVFIFGAYFYCRAATAILVSIMLLIALILQRLGLLKELNYKWVIFISAVSFAVIMSIQRFSIFEGLFLLLGKNSLLGGRLRIWNAAFSGWLDNFWMGIGIDAAVTSTVLNQHGFLTAGWGNYIGHAHNILLEALLKSGFLGTCCFVGQLLVCYRGMMIKRKSKIAKFLCVMLILFWITSLLDYRIEQIGGWLLIMLLYDVELLDDSCQRY